MTGREASSQETEVRPSSYNSRLSVKKGASRTLLRQRCFVNEHCDLLARHTDRTETATTTRLAGFLLSTKQREKRETVHEILSLQLKNPNSMGASDRMGWEDALDG